MSRSHRGTLPPQRYQLMDGRGRREEGHRGWGLSRGKVANVGDAECKLMVQRGFNPRHNARTFGYTGGHDHGRSV